jgi:hypothetical protein
MGSLADEYGQRAAYCHQRAKAASSPEIAREWLQMAGAWLAMAQFRHRKTADGLPEEDVPWSEQETDGVADKRPAQNFLK